MTAASRNITIEQRSTFRAEIQCTPQGSSTPIDLTGYTARMDIRLSAKSEDVIISLTTTNGGLTIDAPNGTISVYISDEQTSLLTFSKAFYDILVEASSGEAYRLVQGTVFLSPGVTR